MAGSEQGEPDVQNARAMLRERFLHAVNALSGKPTVIDTYGNKVVKADFHCVNFNGSAVAVKNLVTPVGHVYNSALIRLSDIISIEFQADVAAT